MVVKKGIEKTTAKKPSFIEATGRRKTSISRVRLWLEKNGKILINEKPIEEFFTGVLQKKIYEKPFRVLNRMGEFSANIKVEGGGKSSQVKAVVLGLSRALASFDNITFRPLLAKNKLLTRDSREKEQRRYGHAGKARKRKQSPKR